MPCGPRARLTAYVAYQTLAFAERDVLLAALADAGYTVVSKPRPQVPTPPIPCRCWIPIVASSAAPPWSSAANTWRRVLAILASS